MVIKKVFRIYWWPLFYLILVILSVAASVPLIGQVPQNVIRGDHTFDEIIALADGTFVSPQKTFANFIKGNLLRDIKLCISCQTGKARKECIPIGESEPGFDAAKLKQVSEGFKREFPFSFVYYKDIIVDSKNAKIQYTTISVRGKIEATTITTLSFSQEGPNWKISDIATRPISRRILN